MRLLPVFSKKGTRSGMSLACSLFVVWAPASAQSVAQYGYDALGRVVSSQDGVGTASTYQYDAASNRRQSAMAAQFAQYWTANSAGVGHATGRQEGDAWSATVNDARTHMWYGPYTRDVPAGSHVAAFRMLVDNNNADNSQVVQLDVWDSTAGTELAVRNVTRMEWKAAYAYQVFELPFQLDQSSAGDALEFRIYYLRTSYVRTSRVGYR